MTDRPILFSGEMVNAIREGRKTQTRRVMKPQPVLREEGRPSWMCDTANRWDFFARNDDGYTSRSVTSNGPFTCRYAEGDTPLIPEMRSRLWVRERQRVIEERGRPRPKARPTEIRVRYEADGAESGWIDYPSRLKGVPVIGKCLSYGGYRESSRLTLEVTSVRVERLQDISEGDAVAEGVTPLVSLETWTCVPSDGGTFQQFVEPPADQIVSDGIEFVKHSPEKTLITARQGFVRLWNSINGKMPGCSWESNPWVWVVGFRGVEA